MLLLLFGVLILYLLLVFLCDRVENVPFEEEAQEQQFDEDQQHFVEGGKCSSPPACSTLPIDCI